MSQTGRGTGAGGDHTAPFGLFSGRGLPEQAAVLHAILVNIRDLDQYHAPFLESYLEALGHGIIITRDGDFLHTHPSKAGDTIIFHAGSMEQDFYRLFVQFKAHGEVITAVFDWKPMLQSQP